MKRRRNRSASKRKLMERVHKGKGVQCDTEGESNQVNHIICHKKRKLMCERHVPPSQSQCISVHASERCPFYHESQYRRS